MKRTGFIYHERYFWHHTGNGALMLPVGNYIEADEHIENPKAKRRVKNLLESSDYINELHVIKPRPASVEEVALIHSNEYINKVKELSDTTGGDAVMLAVVGPESYEIALLAVGGVLQAVDSIMGDEIDNAYVLTRPPGHHAEKEMGMGFCLFNNVAIAAKYARKQYDIEKIMIIDWDVHHGNGTESAFYNDPNTLFISIHQEYAFPDDRGFMSHIGEEEGIGYNVNIPLPAGTAGNGYLHVFENIIVPIAEEFKPELILVSAGQDGSQFDPLGRMLLNSNDYKEMTTIVKNLAEKYCDGKLIAVHEGGYSAAYVPFCTLKIIEALSGIDSNIIEPFPPPTDEIPIYANQLAVINNVKKIHSNYWASIK